MSYAAIYDVTKALRLLLLSQLGGGEVTLLPPGDTLPEKLGVNFYLYRVLESPFTKNQPWRGDKTTSPSNQPALGLQLFYLLTPIATTPQEGAAGDDAHTMMGRAMLTLHEYPILNTVHIAGFDADLVLPDYLLNSYEQIKTCLLPVGLEELSKIWASINRPYRLSVAYEVTLVELTPTPPPPVGGGIVTFTGLNVITFDPPRLTALAPALGALAHLVGSMVTPNNLQITGFGFSFPGQQPIVRVGGQVATITGTSTPPGQALTISLPTDLDAGPQADVSVTLNQRSSMPLPFLVTPWLERLTPMRTALEPTTLKLVLQGKGFMPPGFAPVSVPFEPAVPNTPITVFDAGGTDMQATVTLPTSLPNGLYSLRIALNDPTSSVTNARTLEVIPLLSGIALAVVTATNSAGATINVHQLTLTGARLDGADVRVVIDGVNYQAGKNTNAAQLAYTLGRLLDPGGHTVAVNVDGHLSHDLNVGV